MVTVTSIVALNEEKAGVMAEKTTLWVDNLPKDEIGLRSMLAEVRRQI